MLFLPDTNVWIKHLNAKPSPIKIKISHYLPSQIALCDVVKAELYYGAFKSMRCEENLDLLETLFTNFQCFTFDGKAARIFGELRAHLARKGTPIGPYDLQIAAIALANDCILVSHNTSEFSRIANLKLEDWEVL